MRGRTLQASLASPCIWPAAGYAGQLLKTNDARCMAGIHIHWSCWTVLGYEGHNDESVVPSLIVSKVPRAGTTCKFAKPSLCGGDNIADKSYKLAMQPTGVAGG